MEREEEGISITQPETSKKLTSLFHSEPFSSVVVGDDSSSEGGQELMGEHTIKRGGRIRREVHKFDEEIKAL